MWASPIASKPYVGDRMQAAFDGVNHGAKTRARLTKPGSDALGAFVSNLDRPAVIEIATYPHITSAATVSALVTREISVPGAVASDADSPGT